MRILVEKDAQNDANPQSKPRNKVLRKLENKCVLLCRSSARSHCEYEACPAQPLGCVCRSGALSLPTRIAANKTRLKAIFEF